MFGSLIAIALAQAAIPAAAAEGVPAAPGVTHINGWQVAGTDRGCIVHAAYRGGTVLSVFGMPGSEGIGFLLQNPGWTDLEDGGVYALDIRFAGGSDWTIPAVARRHIDHDGPGLFFSVSPGSLDDGRDFLGEFAGASGMQVGSRGATVERLALTGSHDATVALARCMSAMVGGAHAAEAPVDQVEAPDARAI